MKTTAKKMTDFKPIIHIIGLPGVGKTTLSEKLVRELKLSVFRIGKYRSKFPTSITGEADTWIALYRDLSRKKWRNCILETTGLNSRESFLNVAIPLSGRITIKLEAKKKVLYERIKKKNKSDQGCEWLFSANYHSKSEFVKKLFKEFKEIPALISIDTSDLTPHEVYKTVLKELKYLGVEKGHNVKLQTLATF